MYSRYRQAKSLHREMEKIRNCLKSPSQGGLSRQEANRIAEEYGIDYRRYSRKADLCSALLEAVTVREKTTIPTNAEIASMLEKAAEEKANPYAKRALKEAAARVLRAPPIASVEDIKKIPGLGSGSLRRIIEYWNTGTVPAEEKEQEVKVSPLTEVKFIGPATAASLEEKGITTLEELRKNLHLLNRNQRYAAQHHEQLQKRIPRETITVIADIILEILASISDTSTGEVVGSYRRGLPTSGDIDILITDSENKNHLRELVESIDGIEHIFSFGPVKFQGVILTDEGDRYGLDIRYVPYESRIPALLHATGSDSFNVWLRERALEQGMSLSEHGLRDLETNTIVKVESEEELLNTLGLPYIPPELRGEENLIYWNSLTVGE
jgi:DNA polymerase/3'-5' exonuclease PolX